VRPSLRDRFIAALARTLARRFFRSVETVGEVPRPGPVILAASHLNGFVDPVLLVATLGVLPRFLAKGTLWKVVLARPFLRFARIIPVHRRQDSEGVVDNTATFSTAVAALAEGHLLAVFPEGTTHDDPTLRPLRTGVARIALQASAGGIAGVEIVPVGVSYEDKVAVRGRALVHFGRPLAVEADERSLGADGAPAAGPVRELTSSLQAALHELTPHFSSTEEALALAAGARIALRTEAGGGRPVPLAEVTALARRLGAAGADAVDRVVSTVARYEMLLTFAELTDEDLIARDSLRATARRSVWLAVLVVLLAPMAVAGLFANVVPVLLVLAAGLLPSAPVSKGTVRLLTALVVFPLTWLAIAIWDVGVSWIADLTQLVTFPVDPLMQGAFGNRSGFWAGALVFIAAPVFGVITVVVVDRIRALGRDLQSWWTLRDRRGQLAEIRAKRAEVLAVTATALAGARRG
jgi:glycerol-3-phosphate O-acyltransferase/dihydroxyacetone phosphate acyltransferase